MMENSKLMAIITVLEDNTNRQNDIIEKMARTISDLVEKVSFWRKSKLI